MKKLCMIVFVALLSAHNISTMDDSADYLSIQKRIEELRQELNEINEFDISNQERDKHETAIMDEIYKLYEQIRVCQQAKKQAKK